MFLSSAPAVLSSTSLSTHGRCWRTADTHHVEKHDDAEVDADSRAGGRHLRVVPDESPAEGSEGADGDHAVNDDAKHGGDHHQYLWRQYEYSLYNALYFYSTNKMVTHHEKYPRWWDHEAAVFVGEGLVRLRLPGDRVHSLLLRVFGLELGADFILESNKMITDIYFLCASLAPSLLHAAVFSEVDVHFNDFLWLNKQFTTLHCPSPSVQWGTHLTPF